MLAERSQVHAADKTLSVTLSLGGACARADDTVDSLVKRADSLMYASKQNGRNRVTVEG